MMRTPDGHNRLELSHFLTPPTVADHRNAPVNALGYLRVMFAVDDIDETLARLRKHGAELVGEVVQYEDVYRICYIRGHEGLLIGLAQELGCLGEVDVGRTSGCPRPGLWDHFQYMQEGLDTIAVHELTDGQKVTLADTTVLPFPLAEEYVYAFLLTEGNRRALIAPDELKGWSPPTDLQEVDVAVLPMGILEFHPLTRERLIHQDHRLLRLEATFDETLEVVGQLGAEQVYLTHIEEMDQTGFEELQELESRLQGDGLPISFACDTLIVDV